MDDMPATFDDEVQNGFVSIVCTIVFPYMSTVTLTTNINRVHPMVDMYAKFDKYVHDLPTKFEAS